VARQNTSKIVERTQQLETQRLEKEAKLRELSEKREYELIL
jgi:hypothetical protein